MFGHEDDKSPFNKTDRKLFLELLVDYIPGRHHDIAVLIAPLKCHKDHITRTEMAQFVLTN